MGDRISIVLACSVCGARNYRTTRARRTDAKAIELKKFCATCKQHTVHRESK